MRTPLEFLPLAGNLRLSLRALLYYFWLRKPFFSALSAHLLTKKNIKTGPLKGA